MLIPKKGVWFFLDKMGCKGSHIEFKKVIMQINDCVWLNSGALRGMIQQSQNI